MQGPRGLSSDGRLPANGDLIPLRSPEGIVEREGEHPRPSTLAIQTSRLPLTGRGGSTVDLGGQFLPKRPEDLLARIG